MRIHSGRLFAGVALRPEEKVTVELATELRANLNPERTQPREISAFGDVRVVNRGMVTYRLNGTIQVGVRATASYVSAPSVRPAPAGASFEQGYAPLASRWDATADAVATVSIL